MPNLSGVLPGRAGDCLRGRQKTLRVVRQQNVSAVSYGLSDQQDVYATAIVTEGFHSSFVCLYPPR